MSILQELDWLEIKAHYSNRVNETKNLRDLYENKNVSGFADLALGMTTPTGNYSASEHGLGPKILESNLNAKGRIYSLAGKFILLKDASTVPKLIREENLKYLRIGVGSELSCMMNPTACWVCNKRTIWLYLAQTQGLREANEALQLFNEHADNSPMAYESWQDAYHPELGPELKRVAEDGAKAATSRGVVPGEVPYLWADAIASNAFDFYRSANVG
ncbi:MAG TPA: hypothetical protein VG225_14975 [Terracidiphilus sp.]|jgi:hypothetical protein|nr:hypothetical protein [Terracidiphilus sp.]